MSVEKTVVLITGANSGIGLETAKLFTTSSDSYHVLLACRDSKKAEDAVASIRAAGARSELSIVQLELTDAESIKKAAAHVSSIVSKIDFLINNAGFISKAPDLPTQMKEIFEVNTAGQAAVTEAFKPLLKKSSNPRVIFLTSSLGSITLRCDPTNKSYHGSGIAYRVSKAGLDMLAACYAKELHDEFKCKVWALDPGLVATNLTGDAESLRARGALEPSTSAATIMDTCLGKRDTDVGKLIYKDGVYPW